MLVQHSLLFLNKGFKTMNKELDSNLRLDSILNDLNLFYTSININQKVSEVQKIFRNDVHTPGIILVSEKGYMGMISRRNFFEYLSRPYSRELYLNRSIQSLYEDNPNKDILILPSSMSISKATYLALQRKGDQLYEPVVVELKLNSCALIDVHQLLLAQSYIHFLTVKSLEKANDFKSEMLSIAAHDLKNPLNAILGFSKLIMDDTSDKNQTVEMSELIYNSAQRMLQLIVKILDSAAIEHKKMELKRSLTNLYLLAKNTVENNKKLAGKKGQILLLKNNDEELWIKADPIRIQDAMDNLISNAIKYSPLNSDIIIELERLKNTIRFSVLDNGPGIHEEDKKKLFEKFQRLSARPTGGESSTGLGLYIVKQTVVMHHGSIWVESEQGKGSKFIFELPCIDEYKTESLLNFSFLLT